MIARVDGQVVLVEGAVPGERVTARISRVDTRVAYAVVDSVETPSPDRRPAADPRCGGCLYAHISYARQLAIKAEVIADAFKRLGKIELPGPVAVAASPETAYRMRARLHMSGGRLGFYREGTHDLCDAATTGQLLPETCDLLDHLSAGLNSLAIRDVRDVEISENVEATERAVHVVLGGHPAQLSGLARTPGLTGLSASTGPGLGVTVLGGTPFVTDRLTIGAASLTLQRHVLSFFQGNRHLFAPLVEHVTSLVPEGARVVDLYAGGGAFALAAAAGKGARVTAVEGDPIASADLSVNVEQAGAVVEAISAPVETFEPAGGEAPDVVIVDSPSHGDVEGRHGPRARPEGSARGVRVLRRGDAGSRRQARRRCRLSPHAD